MKCSSDQSSNVNYWYDVQMYLYICLGHLNVAIHVVSTEASHKLSQFTSSILHVKQLNVNGDIGCRAVIHIEWTIMTNILITAALIYHAILSLTHQSNYFLSIIFMCKCWYENWLLSSSTPLSSLLSPCLSLHLFHVVILPSRAPAADWIIFLLSPSSFQLHKCHIHNKLINVLTSWPIITWLM